MPKSVRGLRGTNNDASTLDIDLLRETYFNPSTKWNVWVPSWTRRSPAETDLTERPSEYISISLCTTCMNRAHDLKVTLPQNIADNQDYPNVEFVVLNYGGSDDLEAWMAKEMSRQIASGLVTYCRTSEPSFYEMGRSRNIAFRVARGRIVTNIDADNYTGPGFATNLNRLAEVQREKAVFAGDYRSFHGQIGFYKSEFLTLGGYDESLIGYGFDDLNLLHRALCAGYTLVSWQRLGDCSRRIETPRDVVTSNMEHKDYRNTQALNRLKTFEDLANGRYVANSGRRWGQMRLTRNFAEEIVT